MSASTFMDACFEPLNVFASISAIWTSGRNFDQFLLSTKISAPGVLLQNGSLILDDKTSWWF